MTLDPSMTPRPMSETPRIALVVLMPISGSPPQGR